MAKGMRFKNLSINFAKSLVDPKICICWGKISERHKKSRQWPGRNLAFKDRAAPGELLEFTKGESKYSAAGRRKK